MEDSQVNGEAIDGAEGPDLDRSQPKQEFESKLPADSSRRTFCKVGGVTAITLAAGIPLAPLFEGKHGQAEASVISYGSGVRAEDSFAYRSDTALAEKLNVGELPTMAIGRDLATSAGAGASHSATMRWECPILLPGRAWSTPCTRDASRISRTSW